MALPALAADPPAGTPFIARTLLDRTLTPHSVLVHRIDASTITYTDSRGLLRREPTSAFLALLPGDGPTGWQPRASVHSLALIDGQRFPGLPLATPASDDPPLLWDAGFAHLTIPLDAIASVTCPGNTPPAPDSTGDDTVRLANGDTLTGFILALGPSISIETAAGVTDLSLDLIAWARIANPAAPPAGPMLWLADGTVACVEVLPQITPDSLEARLIPALAADPTLSEDSGDSASGRARLSFPLAAVRALAFDPALLLPLGSLPLAAASSDRPWTPPLSVSDALDEPLGAPDITFPAPMRATWVIPANAIRLTFAASLPPRSRVWGDCELVLTLDQDGSRSEISRTRFAAESDHATVNIALPAPSDPRRDRRLTIELHPGPSGPAQDTLVLTRPLLLLDAP